MKEQTWRQWARAAIKDASSPSRLHKGCLAGLTGQDSRALDAIAACWQLYAVADDATRRRVLLAVNLLLKGMQMRNVWIARELLPFALDWDDRDRVWTQLNDMQDVTRWLQGDEL